MRFFSNIFSNINASKYLKWILLAKKNNIWIILKNITVKKNESITLKIFGDKWLFNFKYNKYKKVNRINEKIKRINVLKIRYPFETKNWVFQLKK